MVRRIHKLKAEERGFTLIELLVYALLLSFVIAIIGGMIFSSVTASRTVTSMTQNSTSGQLVADSVITGIRNSSDFQLSAPVTGDQMLVARRATSGATLNWICVAWYYSGTDKSVRYTTSSLAILPPTTTELANWTLLADNVEPLTGTNIFSALNERLSMSILGLDGAHRPIDISTSATSPAGASGSVSCF